MADAWDGKTWPPPDRLVHQLSDLIDASPRGDWLTSNERVHEAERLIKALRSAGYRTRDQTGDPVICKPHQECVDLLVEAARADGMMLVRRRPYAALVEWAKAHGLTEDDEDADAWLSVWYFGKEHGDWEP